MKRNASMMWTFCTFVVFVLVLGCSHTASVGKKIDFDAVSKIKKGETTKSQVSSLLGPPKSIQSYSGKETWTYSYSSMEMKMFYFGGDLGEQKSELVMVMFDENGVVEDFMSQRNE